VFASVPCGTSLKRVHSPFVHFVHFAYSTDMSMLINASTTSNFTGNYCITHSSLSSFLFSLVLNLIRRKGSPELRISLTTLTQARKPSQHSPIAAPIAHITKPRGTRQDSGQRCGAVSAPLCAALIPVLSGRHGPPVGTLFSEPGGSAASQVQFCVAVFVVVSRERSRPMIQASAGGSYMCHEGLAKPLLSRNLS
jgi:hypothetical protein